jgi:hypothetical protein
MKRKIKVVRYLLIILVLTALTLASCEQIFTTSFLEWAQRDPANLSDAGKISYAYAILGSSNATDADYKDAYNALKDVNDEEAQYLASQLAVSAAGLDDAVDYALNNEGATEAEILGQMDGTWLNNAISSFDQAVAGGAEIPQEDYLTMAAAIIANEVIKGDFGDIEAAITDIDGGTADPELQTAESYIQAAGYSLTDMDELMDLVQV